MFTHSKSPLENPPRKTFPEEWLRKTVPLQKFFSNDTIE